MPATRTGSPEPSWCRVSTHCDQDVGRQPVGEAEGHPVDLPHVLGLHRGQCREHGPIRGDAVAGAGEDSRGRPSPRMATTGATRGPEPHDDLLCSGSPTTLCGGWTLTWGRRHVRHPPSGVHSRPNQRRTRSAPKSDLSAASSRLGPSSAPRGACTAEEGHLDLAHLPCAELQVADAAAVVRRRVGLAADPGDQLRGDDRGLALGEHARLRGADAGDVAHGVHVRRTSCAASAGRPGSSRPRPGPTRGRPRARGAPARRGRGRRASRSRPPAGRSGWPGRGSGRGCPGARRCRARRTRSAAPRDAAGDGGIGTPSGITSDTLDRSSRPRAARWSWTSSAVSLGAGGHLNGVEVTATTTCPPSNDDEHVTRRERAGHRVELVAGLDQARRRLRVQVGPERHHEHVAVQRTVVGLDPARGRVDGADRGLHEADAGRREVGVAVQDVVRARPART